MRDSNSHGKDDYSPEAAETAVIEGRNAVREALRAGRSINRVFVLEGRKGAAGGDSRLKELAAEVREAKIPVVFVPARKLDKLSLSGKHQGIVAMAAAKEYADADEVIAAAIESKGSAAIIILDEIFDGRNLASIIRSAECCGLDLLVIPTRRAASLDAYVSRESAGALEYMPVARVSNLRAFVDKIKKRDFWVYGLDPMADMNYKEVDPAGNIAIVVGSEGKGIAKKLREDCDFLISIPMAGHLNSLNAAVAAAVVAFEFASKRKGEG